MANVDPSGIERRRSARIKLAVPLRVIGQSRSGEEFSVEAETHTVSNSGCLLQLQTDLFVNQPLELRNEKSGQSIKGRVVSTWRQPGGKVFAGLEFASPSPNFWPVELPASQSSASLPRRE
jgi:PilZ domain